jgi:hypothetical protein
MDDEVNTLLFGVIILILVINTFSIWSMADAVFGTGSQQKILSGTSTDLPKAPQDVPIPSAPAPAATPAKTPVPASTPTSAPIQTEAQNSKKGIITVESPTPEVTGSREMLQPERPSQSYKDYITIYSLTNQSLNQKLPHVSVNLINPPLILDYSVMPVTSTDIKPLDYKLGSTEYHENLSVLRAYEQAWFLVTVRDKDSRTIVFESGYGKTFGLETPKQLAVRESGTYEFEFGGDFANVNLTMKVKKEGNNL